MYFPWMVENGVKWCGFLRNVRFSRPVQMVAFALFVEVENGNLTGLTKRNLIAKITPADSERAVFEHTNQPNHTQQLELKHATRHATRRLGRKETQNSIKNKYRFSARNPQTKRRCAIKEKRTSRRGEDKDEMKLLFLKISSVGAAPRARCSLSFELSMSERERRLFLCYVLLLPRARSACATCELAPTLQSSHQMSLPNPIEKQSYNI